MNKILTGSAAFAVENQALRAKLAELEREVAELRADRTEDSKGLDWLEDHTARTDVSNVEQIKPRWFQPNGSFTTWEIYMGHGRQPYTGKTLRAAIKAARGKA